MSFMSKLPSNEGALERFAAAVMKQMDIKMISVSMSLDF